MMANKKQGLRTKPTRYSKGTPIQDIVGVIFYAGTNEPGLIECITEDGHYRQTKPEDIIPQDLLQERIKKFLKNT